MKTLRILSFLFTFIVAAVAAASTGPFVFRSEYDPLYQRPPYVTGVTSCSGILESDNKTTVEELKSAVPKLAARVLKRLIANELKYSKFKTKERVLTEVRLDRAYCRGASVFLIQEIDKMGLKLELSTAKTEHINPIEAQHIYLVDQNYFGEGKPLIIDPTIRQFFSKYMSEEEMEQKIPLIFIGTKEEITTLFMNHIKTNTPNWSPERVAQEYLKTYIHPNLFDPSY